MIHRTLLLLLFFSLLCSTWLGGVTAQQDMHKGEQPQYGSTEEGTSQEDSDLDRLMGAEECVEGDESCTLRRMTAEAHLDYIYTQQLKP